MNRRNFISSSVLATSSLAAFASLLNSKAYAEGLSRGADVLKSCPGLEVNFVKPGVGVTPMPQWVSPPAYKGLLDVIPVWKDSVTDGGKMTLLRGQKGLVMPSHIHPAGEVIFVIDGEVVITSHMGNPEEAEEYTMRAGDVVWVPAGTHHTREEVRDQVTVLIFEPKPSVY